MGKDKAMNFDPTEKRMNVIVRRLQTGEILVLCKGSEDFVSHFNISECKIRELQNLTDDRIFFFFLPTRRELKNKPKTKFCLNFF